MKTEHLKDLLPEYIEEYYPKIEHSEACLDAGHPDCIDGCPREGYDGSRGIATVALTRFLIWADKKK